MNKFPKKIIFLGPAWALIFLLEIKMPLRIKGATTICANEIINASDYFVQIIIHLVREEGASGLFIILVPKV